MSGGRRGETGAWGEPAEEEQNSDRKTFTFPLGNKKKKKKKEKNTAIWLQTSFPGQNVQLDSVRGENKKSGFRVGTLELFIKEVEKCSSLTLELCC